MKTPQDLNRQILEEASAWFVDFRLGDIDARAREQFDEWLRRSPEHIRAYMDIARTYVALPALATEGKFDVAQLIASARAEGNVVAFEARGPSAHSGTDRVMSDPDTAGSVSIPVERLRSRRRHLLGVAASLVALAGTITAAWLVLPHDRVYSTDIGERRTLTLADGSSIDLNARSKVQIRFSKTERDVELLAGQALFEVAKDPTRPFVVRAGETRVRAVGTEFDVNRRPSGTTVTVIEGTVALSQDIIPSSGDHNAGAPVPRGSAGTSVLEPTWLSAGEQATVSERRVLVTERVDVSAATAWTQHRLVLDGSRLADVVDDFNRYNPRQLIIEDRELDDFHVSGVYSSTDPASLIRFLKAQPNIAVLETDQGVRITRR